jgi:dolichol-phosphate mannosyltransferase
MTYATLVILPTYNERSNLERIVNEVLATKLAVDLLIVDDNSPDGTGELAQALTTQYPGRIYAIHRSVKAGLGAAYLAGFHWALTQGYEYVVEMDADGSHHPDELSTLLEPVYSGADLVIGTRWMPGGIVRNWSLTRRAISRFGTWYASKALRLPLRDLTSGYRVLSLRLVQKILESGIQSAGYGFQIEVALLAHDQNLAIVERPITFTERLGGQSKMSKAIVLEAWWKTTLWSLQRTLNRR